MKLRAVLPLSPAVALTIIVLMCAAQANAHDSWINAHQWRNPAGEWCCGADDCGVVLQPDRAVTTVPGGYHVRGIVQIDGTSSEGETQQGVDAIIPYNQRLPSPDGQYWYCRRDDNTPRCFFAPTPSY